MRIARQRPGTAKDMMFMSLEDETGIVNGYLSRPSAENRVLLISEALLVEGILHQTM